MRSNAFSAHLRFWPTGVPTQAYTLSQTLPQRLAQVAAEVGEKAALVFATADGQHGLSYAQLWAQIERVAGFLQQGLGLAAGERVLIVGQNAPQWIVAFQAVLRAGAVAVPANTMCKREELEHLARHSGARLAIAQGSFAPLLQALGVGLRGADEAATTNCFDALLLWPDGPAAGSASALQPATPRSSCIHQWHEALACSHPAGPLPTDPHGLAVLAYTSGTTGAPKGCMHSHASLLAALTASAAWKPLTRESVALAVAPLFHMLGLQNGMHLPLISGATAVMMPRWDAATAARVIEEHKVSAWSAPPAMVIDLFNHPASAGRDFSSLRLLSGGGAAMPQAVAGMLLERYGLRYQEAYGLTETASFLHANPPARCKRQCLGVPTQGVDSRIVDPETLQELPAGEVGELVTHAPQVMQGYWHDEAATAAAFITLDGKRFLRTGDLAHVDEDGYFFLRDRLKRMVNVSGYKVWPAEVESFLYAHPAVHEACVIAVPDAKQGERVKALVVLKPGAQPAPTAEAFIAWCRERMAVYKAPREVVFVPDLLKLATGKIAWRELQQAHAKPAHSPPDPTSP